MGYDLARSRLHQGNCDFYGINTIVNFAQKPVFWCIVVTSRTLALLMKENKLSTQKQRLQHCHNNQSMKRMHDAETPGLLGIQAVPGLSIFSCEYRLGSGASFLLVLQFAPGNVSKFNSNAKLIRLVSFQDVQSPVGC
mmetsp:Transcript_50121/g.150873  ORF Transcript_50121/g.150873 Transcript_50121/m.150873 type:complete len:138 (-) Transcript_50121:310-723(-)